MKANAKAHGPRPLNGLRTIAVASLVLTLAGCERRWNGDDAGGATPTQPAASPTQDTAESIEAERERKAIEALPSCPPSRFRFTPGAKLSVTEIADLGHQVHSPSYRLDNGQLATLTYRQFAFPNGPHRGRLDGVAVVYARLETGKAIGGILWTSAGDKTLENMGVYRLSLEGLDLTFRQPPDHLTQPDGGELLTCQGRFHLHLGPDGALIAQGKRAGALGL